MSGNADEFEDHASGMTDSERTDVETGSSPPPPKDSSAHKDASRSNRTVAYVVILSAVISMMALGLGLGLGLGLKDDSKTDDPPSASLPSTTTATTTAAATTTTTPATTSTTSVSTTTTSISEPTTTILVDLDEDLLSLLDLLEPELIGPGYERATFYNPATPHHMALDWMARQDDYSRQMRANNATDESELVERFVATLLYFSTNGDNWQDIDITFLNGNVSICEWHEPLLVNLTLIDFDEIPWGWWDAFPKGVLCNDQDRADVFNLVYTGLEGKIPTEVGLLTHVRHLYLLDNALEGPIPSEIGEMSSLAMFFVHQNNLSDEIPSEMGQLSQLSMLSIFSNPLIDGEFPSELGSLSALKRLYVDGTALKDGLEQVVCEREDAFPLLEDFWSDCLGDPAEIECSCCTNCCTTVGCD